MHLSKLIILFTFAVYFCGCSEVKENHVSPKNGSLDIELQSLEVSVGVGGSSVKGNVYFSDTASCLIDVAKYTLRLKCGCSYSPIDSVFFSYSDGEIVNCLLTPKQASCSMFEFFYGCGIYDKDNYNVVTFSSIDLVSQQLGIASTWVYVIFTAVVAIILICCIWCCCRCCHCCCYNKKVPEYYVASGYSQI